MLAINTGFSVRRKTKSFWAESWIMEGNGIWQDTEAR